MWLTGSHYLMKPLETKEENSVFYYICVSVEASSCSALSCWKQGTLCLHSWAGIALELTQVRGEALYSYRIGRKRSTIASTMGFFKQDTGETTLIG